MKLKSKILLCITFLALLLPLNSAVSAYKPNTQSPAFAQGFQISNEIRQYYRELSVSPCTETIIRRITDRYLAELQKKIGITSTFGVHDPILITLNNRVVTIKKISKRLLDMLHGTAVDKKGKQIRKSPAEIQEYCKRRSKTPTRYDRTNTLDSFVVPDDCVEYMSDDENSSGNESGNESDSGKRKTPKAKRLRRTVESDDSESDSDSDSEFTTQTERAQWKIKRRIVDSDSSDSELPKKLVKPQRRIIDSDYSE